MSRSVLPRGAVPAAALALAFGGCVVPPPALRAPAPEAVQISSAATQPAVNVLGIPRRFDPPSRSYYVLRSSVPRAGGAVTHQLYVLHSYRGDWEFWDRAARQDRGHRSDPLDFISIAREVGGCSGGGCTYTEAFGVAIPDSLLRANPAGYSVTFYARSGREATVTLERAQIGQQLGATDSLRAILAPALVRAAGGAVTPPPRP